MKKKQKMKELDVVRLTKEFEGIPAGLPVGTEGTIVSYYDGKMFDIEFFDDEYNTIDVLITPVEILELIWEYKSKK